MQAGIPQPSARITLQLECGARFIFAGMRLSVLVLALAVSLLGCESKKPKPAAASPTETKPTTHAPLVDLTPASTLARRSHRVQRAQRRGSIPDPSVSYVTRLHPRGP